MGFEPKFLTLYASVLTTTPLGDIELHYYMWAKIKSPSNLILSPLKVV